MVSALTVLKQRSTLEQQWRVVVGYLMHSDCNAKRAPQQWQRQSAAHEMA